MLGPEQLNLAPRVSPQNFSTLPLIQFSSEAVKGLSLNSSQVITAVIAMEHGRLFLSTRMSQEPIPLPMQYMRWLGKEARFQMSHAKSGLLTLTPINISSNESLPAQQAQPLRPSDLLRSLTLATEDRNMAGVNFQHSADLRSLANISSASFLQNPIAQLLKIFQINGYTIGKSQNAPAMMNSSLVSELLKMLRKIEDPSRRAAVLDLLEELKIRFSKAESAQRHDLFIAELLALLDEVPVDLSFFRGNRDDEADSSAWTVNVGVSFDKTTQVSVQLRLDRVKNLYVDVWFTDNAMFRVANENEAILRAEMQGYGVNVVQINMFDAKESSDNDTTARNLDISI